MTEMNHEHRWTDWQASAWPARDGIVREWRWCAEWMCHAVEIRPARLGAPPAEPSWQDEVGLIAARHIVARVSEEAAAMALFDIDYEGTGEVWADALDLTKGRYRREARRVLAAVARALSLDWPGSPTAAVEPHTGIQAAERKSGQDDT